MVMSSMSESPPETSRGFRHCSVLDCKVNDLPETPPFLEQVAQCLTKGQGTAARPLTVPTLLSQSNRSAGRDRV